MPEAVGLPPSAAVLDELVVLRKRDGLTLSKLQACSAMLGLPATSDELRRGNLHDSDRHVAALRVLKATVDRVITRTGFTRVLMATLNFDETETNLEFRREKVRAELFLTTRSLRGLEDAAYAQLAGSLVALQKSPCAENIESEPAKEPTLERSASDDLVSYLARLLVLLTCEHRPAVREELSSRILAQLPRLEDLMHQAAGAPGSSTTSLVELQQLLTELGPPRDSEPKVLPRPLAQGRPPREPVNEEQVGAALEEERVKSQRARLLRTVDRHLGLLLGPTLEKDLDKPYRRVARRLADERAVSDRGGEGELNFYDWKGKASLRLAEVLVEYEGVGIERLERHFGAQFDRPGR